MLNDLFDGDRPNVALLSALSARYTLPELYSASRDARVIRCYWYPDGKSGRARVWRGVVTPSALSVVRRLVGIARGRAVAFDELSSVPAGGSPSLSSAPIGTTIDGFDRIETMKWTTDGTTRRKLPPGTMAWRDFYTGKVYVRHPSRE